MEKEEEKNIERIRPASNRGEGGKHRASGERFCAEWERIMGGMDAVFGGVFYWRRVLPARRLKRLPDRENDGTVHAGEICFCSIKVKQKLKTLLKQALKFSKFFMVLVYENAYKGSMHVNKENKKSLHFSVP